MAPVISIIVPVYNAEETLGKCLDSLAAQSCADIEIILVDDGSGDGSGRLCDEYAKKDSRFRVIHKENGGSSSARNAGLDAARGEYVGFVDSDDYIEPDMYESLLKAHEDLPGYEIAQILSMEENEKGEIIKEAGHFVGAGPEHTQELEVIAAKEFFRELMLHTGDSSFCTKLIRMSFMKDYRFTEGRLNEDFELLIRMIESIKGVISVPKLGYHIVLTSESNTRGTFRRSFYEAVMQNAERMLEYGEERYPDCKQEVRHFYMVQAMWMLLHIPAGEMNSENELYVRVRDRLRGMKDDIRTNPYLDEKYRRNLKLLTSPCARQIKQAHALYVKMRSGK